jgi:macrolide transport system ATP-binding/permease protein
MLVTPEMRAFVFSFNFILWAIVLSLLCANLANLLLARGAQRRREIAVRLSVGASRARLIRQFLTESTLLSVAGGLAGIALAYWITHMMSSLQISSQMPVRMDLRPDLRVLAFTLAVSLAAGIGFGVAPAMVSVRTDIGPVLKQGAQAPLRGYNRFGLRNLFVVYQVAACLALLLVTAFMITGYQHVARLDPGVQVAGLDLFSIDPLRDGYSMERSRALFAKLPEELSRVNGVRAVALAGSSPFSNLATDQPNTRVSAPAGEGEGREVSSAVLRDRIGANYFATLGVPLVRGREFDRRDQDADTPPGIASPAIVNQSAARQLFGAGDPIGRTIREGAETYSVIGVARDVRSGSLPPKPVATVFLPLTADWFVRSRAPRATILARGPGDQVTLGSVRDQLTSLHPDLTVFNVHTMREDLEKMNTFMQWSSAIYTVLAVFALLLACIGLGGVTAYAVAQRRKEIGIRMALGARSTQVRGLVLREETALVAIGTVLGFGCTSAIARAASSVTAQLASVFQTRTNDPLLVAGIPLLLAAVAFLACYLPARRATRIDPVSALREQ